MPAAPRLLAPLLLLSALSPAAAQAPDATGPIAAALAAPPASTAPRPGLVTTRVESHRRLPATVSDASVSIEVHGRDLRATATQLGRQAQALLTFLRTQPAERLRTEGTSFEPEIQELRNQPDRIKGYTGRITVSFRTTPDQLPFLLAGCLDNGATALGQFGSTPREEEVESARRDMVDEATRAAMAQLRAIAAAADQRLAGLERVQVDPPPPNPLAVQPYREYADRAAAAPARPVLPIASAPGDSSLSVTVLITARLANP